MAHETHSETNPAREKSKVSFVSSFWLVVILVGLFIGALNFIPAMSEKEEGKVEKKEATEEMAKPASEEAKAVDTSKVQQTTNAPAPTTTPPTPEHK